MEIFVKRFITTGFIILFSYYCAISQEQNDSISVESSKGRGYHFGLALDYLQCRLKEISDNTPPNYYSSSFFVGKTASITSLHNLNKDWDIGFKLGVSDHVDNYHGPFSFLIATYGYYYPFDNRCFFRFGLECNENIYVTYGGTNLPDFGRLAARYHDNFTFIPSLSLGLGYNYDDRCLLNIGIAIPFRNEYGYYEVFWYGVPSDFIPPFPAGKYPIKLYYTLSAGMAILF